VLAALRRGDRALDLVWCNWRSHWIVVRRGGPKLLAWWSGTWHRGFDIVLRWCGIDGVYRAAFPHEKTSFLPLDNRVVLLARASDLARREKASDRFHEAEEIDEQSELWRTTRRLARRKDAERYARNRHEIDRQWSIGGFDPGQLHDSETDGEALAKMRAGTARQRVARNRVRSTAPFGWEA